MICSDIGLFLRQRAERGRRAGTRLIGGFDQRHGLPAVLDGAHEPVVFARSEALEVRHAVGEGIGEPCAFERHGDPVAGALRLNPELVRLAAWIVEIDSKLQVGGPVRPRYPELASLEAAAEIVVVVDRQGAACRLYTPDAAYDLRWDDCVGGGLPQF